MGPPASGKRTISKMVSSKLRTAHLTPENLIADADSDLKTEAEAFVKKNEVCTIKVRKIRTHKKFAEIILKFEEDSFTIEQ